MKKHQAALLQAIFKEFEGIVNGNEKLSNVSALPSSSSSTTAASSSKTVALDQKKLNNVGYVSGSHWLWGSIITHGDGISECDVLEETFEFDGVSGNFLRTVSDAYNKKHNTSWTPYRLAREIANFLEKNRVNSKKSPQNLAKSFIHGLNSNHAYENAQIVTIIDDITSSVNTSSKQESETTSLLKPRQNKLSLYLPGCSLVSMAMAKTVGYIVCLGASFFSVAAGAPYVKNAMDELTKDVPEEYKSLISGITWALIMGKTTTDAIFAMVNFSGSLASYLSLPFKKKLQATIEHAASYFGYPVITMRRNTNYPLWVDLLVRITSTPLFLGVALSTAGPINAVHQNQSSPLLSIFNPSQNMLTSPNFYLGVIIAFWVNQVFVKNAHTDAISRLVAAYDPTSHRAVYLNISNLMRENLDVMRQANLPGVKQLADDYGKNKDIEKFLRTSITLLQQLDLPLQTLLRRTSYLPILARLISIIIRMIAYSSVLVPAFLAGAPGYIQEILPMLSRYILNPTTITILSMVPALMIASATSSNLESVINNFLKTHAISSNKNKKHQCSCTAVIQAFIYTPLTLASLSATFGMCLRNPGFFKDAPIVYATYQIVAAIPMIVFGLTHLPGTLAAPFPCFAKKAKKLAAENDLFNEVNTALLEVSPQIVRALQVFDENNDPNGVLRALASQKYNKGVFGNVGNSVADYFSCLLLCCCSRPKRKHKIAKTVIGEKNIQDDSLSSSSQHATTDNTAKKIRQYFANLPNHSANFFLPLSGIQSTITEASANGNSL